MPASILARSGSLLEAYHDIVGRTSEFSRKTADLVRANPGSVSDLFKQLIAPTRIIFQRWNLEIIYMLSLEYRLRYSQIRSFVSGISNRSLSLKLDAMEHAGIIKREVSNDKPPHVIYSLTERGQTLSRLTFPMVLHLNMDQGLEAMMRAADVSALEQPQAIRLPNRMAPRAQPTPVS